MRAASGKPRPKDVRFDARLRLYSRIKIKSGAAGFAASTQLSAPKPPASRTLPSVDHLIVTSQNVARFHPGRCLNIFINVLKLAGGQGFTDA